MSSGWPSPLWSPSLAGLDLVRKTSVPSLKLGGSEPGSKASTISMLQEPWHMRGWRLFHGLTVCLTHHFYTPGDAEWGWWEALNHQWEMGHIFLSAKIPKMSNGLYLSHGFQTSGMSQRICTKMTTQFISSLLPPSIQPRNGVITFHIAGSYPMWGYILGPSLCILVILLLCMYFGFISICKVKGYSVLNTYNY